jgi:hypothetical protein
MMKYPLRILVFLLLLNLIISRPSYSQDDTLVKPAIPIYKNGIKAMPTFIPLVGVIIVAGLSFGYEYYITQKHALEIGGYYYYNSNEMGEEYYKYCIMLGYKCFSKSDNKRLNNFWIGPYLSYFNKIQLVSDQGQIHEKRYYYGIGVSGGKKMYLSRNKRWFMDLGFGFSFNAYLDESIFSETKWEDKFISIALLARPILQFGWKF